MSEREDFLARWSRRKREAERETAREARRDAQPSEPEAGKDAGAPPREALPAAEPAPFDPESLPPVESITAATDIRDFLRPGVPSSVRHAALRHVWSADPAIRDYVGLSENSWDFNDPSSILGFGPLLPTDDIRRLVAEVFGELPAAEPHAAEMAADAAPPEQPPAPSSSVQATALPGDSTPDPVQEERRAPGDAPAALSQPPSSQADFNVAGEAMVHREEFAVMQQDDIQEDREASYAALQHHRPRGRALPQ